MAVLKRCSHVRKCNIYKNRTHLMTKMYGNLFTNSLTVDVMNVYKIVVSRIAYVRKKLIHDEEG